MHATCDERREGFSRFLRAGLESGARCVWVAADGTAEGAGDDLDCDAVLVLRQAARRDQLEVVSAAAWHRRHFKDRRAGGPDWLALGNQALAEGYTELRVAGITTCPSADTLEGERATHRAKRGATSLLCSCSLADTTSVQVLELLRLHDASFVCGASEWEVLPSTTAVAAERARLNEQVRSTEEALREANQRKDEFLALLGHELRNPLAPIVTALELMKLRGDDRTDRERGVIERQLTHVTRLVDDLLDISRITRGVLKLKREPVELARVIDIAIEMASPLIEHRGHRLEVTLGAEGLVAYADEMRLAQAIANLLTNAAKYTPAAGRIWIHLERRVDRACIRVGDSGIGMSEEVLAELFGAFFQGRRKVEGAQGGLGLGLALVKSLVEMHQGTASASSAGIGQGSEFTVEVPLIAADQDEVLDTPQPTLPDEILFRPRVLVVDDNRDAADMLGLILGAEGLEVRVAYDAPQAIALAHDFAFEVAVLDIGLPVMDGYELAQRLRTMAVGRGISFIAVTGYGTDADRARSAAAGFSAHFTKPVERHLLLAEVTREPSASQPEPSGWSLRPAG